MKIQTTAKIFLAALRQSVAPNARKKKADIPILRYVRVINNQIIANNLDACSIVPFEGSGEADFLLDYYDAVGLLRGWDGDLSIEYLKETAAAVARTRLSLNGWKFNLDTESVTKFPDSFVEDGPSVTIAKNDFKILLDRAYFAISEEQTRYTLNGALLKVEKGSATLVATDGHRLSMATVPIADSSATLTTLIPANSLKWLGIRLGDEIQISTGEHYQTFRTGGKTLVARRLMGQFPNYEAVFPKDPPIKVTFPSPRDLAIGMARMRRCADYRSGAMIWNFSPEESTLSATSQNRHAEGKLTCTSNGSVRIGFNADYILDFIKRCGTSEVNCFLRDGQSAALFEIENWKYLSMPMRI